MQHRIRIRSLLLVWGWGMIWTHFLKNIHFGRAVVWCEPDDHPFFQSIHSAKYLCFCSSFTSSSWCYMAKVQRSIPSSNQQRRPLPSLLSYSYFIFHFLKSNYPRAKATTYLLHIYNSILVHYLFLQSQKIFVPANVLMKAAEYTSTLCSTDSMCVDILYTLDLV